MRWPCPLASLPRWIAPKASNNVSMPIVWHVVPVSIVSLPRFTSKIVRCPEKLALTARYLVSNQLILLCLCVRLLRTYFGVIFRIKPRAESTKVLHQIFGSRHREDSACSCYEGQRTYNPCWCFAIAASFVCHCILLGLSAQLIPEEYPLTEVKRFHWSRREEERSQKARCLP